MGVLNPVPPMLPKMFRLWVIGLLLPSLALARVLPSSHLNQLRGERVKDPTLDEFTASEDQEMRFRYALSQVLLAPPVEEEVNEQPGRSSLKLPPAVHQIKLPPSVQQIKLPPAVQQERDSMLPFQPYANLYAEEELGEEAELEGLEESLDELPELAAWERYQGPNDLDVEADLEDFEDKQEEEEEDNLENEEDEGDEGEWQDEEDKEEEDEEEDEQEEDEEEEEDWLPELSAGEKYMGPIIRVEGQVPK